MNHLPEDSPKTPKYFRIRLNVSHTHWLVLCDGARRAVCSLRAGYPACVREIGGD
jgi:hypothetical protein